MNNRAAFFALLLFAGALGCAPIGSQSAHSTGQAQPMDAHSRRASAIEDLLPRLRDTPWSDKVRRAVEVCMSESPAHDQFESCAMVASEITNSTNAKDKRSLDFTDRACLLPAANAPLGLRDEVCDMYLVNAKYEPPPEPWLSQARETAKKLCPGKGKRGPIRFLWPSACFNAAELLEDAPARDEAAIENAYWSSCEALGFQACEVLNRRYGTAFDVASIAAEYGRYSDYIGARLDRLDELQVRREQDAEARRAALMQQGAETNAPAPAVDVGAALQPSIDWDNQVQGQVNAIMGVPGGGATPPPANSPATGTPPANSLPTCGPGTILCDDKCIPWSNGSVRPAC